VCAHAVRVAIEKLEGVDTVIVSLNQGLATIRFKPNNRVTVEAVRAAIRDNGFTPRAAEVRLSGELTDYRGKPALALPGTDALYVLSPGAADTRALAALPNVPRGAWLSVVGEIPAPPGKGSREPLPLLVQSLVQGR
jgi:copper chaperone CopZ